MINFMITYILNLYDDIEKYRKHIDVNYFSYYVLNNAIFHRFVWYMSSLTLAIDVM
jgi:hypothetical protein